MEGPEGDVLEHELEAEVLVLADPHQEEDGGVGDTAEVLQLREVGLLPDSHLGQVPELAHHPAVLAGWEHQAVLHQLKLFKIIWLVRLNTQHYKLSGSPQHSTL